MLQPGDGGGQSVGSLHGFEQNWPFAGKGSHEVPDGHGGEPDAVLHEDMKTRAPPPPSASAASLLASSPASGR